MYRIFINFMKYDTSLNVAPPLSVCIELFSLMQMYPVLSIYGNIQRGLWVLKFLGGYSHILNLLYFRCSTKMM